MATTRKKAEGKPVQHTPVHLREGADVFDPRHPAASAFAPVQPAAGVVADDVEEQGQNLAGGPTASEAEGTYADQKEVLKQRHEDQLKVGAGVTPDGPSLKVDGGAAKPAAAGDKK